MPFLISQESAIVGLCCVVHSSIVRKLLLGAKLLDTGDTVLLMHRPLILNKQKVLLSAASSAYKNSLKEVMASPGIASQIKVSSLASPLFGRSLCLV